MIVEYQAPLESIPASSGPGCIDMWTRLCFYEAIHIDSIITCTWWVSRALLVTHVVFTIWYKYIAVLNRVTLFNNIIVFLQEVVGFYEPHGIMPRFLPPKTPYYTRSLRVIVLNIYFPPALNFWCARTRRNYHVPQQTNATDDSRDYTVYLPSSRRKSISTPPRWGWRLPTSTLLRCNSYRPKLAALSVATSPAARAPYRIHCDRCISTRKSMGWTWQTLPWPSYTIYM